MTTDLIETPTLLASKAYSALRHGGAPAAIARVQLGLSAEAAARLERMLLARPGGGPDAMRPSFARHDRHVAAVRAGGGYPVLRETAR